MYEFACVIPKFDDAVSCKVFIFGYELMILVQYTHMDANKMQLTSEILCRKNGSGKDFVQVVRVFF